MIKKCQICGIKVKAIANTRYCRECALKERRKQQKRCRKIQISGQSEQLCSDIHAAIEIGISYGE